MTLAVLAKRCGVTSTYLSLLERNLRTPGRELLFKLSKIFHVSPQFIETGQLGPEDAARRARITLWPETIYVIANHVIVPRLLSAPEVIPEDEDLQLAMQRAWEARHFCEYRAWTATAEGRRTARGLGGRWIVEELIERVAGTGHLQQTTPWDDLARDWGIHRKRSPQHFSAVSDHREATPLTPPHPADCFAFDLETTFRLYEKLPFLYWGFAGKYEREALRDHFVKAAFPALFWSAARAWGDRRMAGWLWYLDVPMDLFAPLARIARQYDSPGTFEASSRRLLEQTAVEDCDVFLGLFPDINGNRLFYAERYGTVTYVGGMLGWHGEAPAFKPVLSRRRSRRKSNAQDLLDLIFYEAEGDGSARAEDALRELAPPHVFPTKGLLMVRRKTKPPPPARLDDQPPEALP